ncbi:hypothetical protein MtrunA17_Chr5g0435391 [Medicago truncatula]|uniref:Uncharacterized protein n=1 Tax=Medicago truncatula TaxID=3880 RepID=A0A396HYH8_MEDTR|nr:hypothetical protein MtrunA17_Chr5g0435391 [Medicago truncatula]
MRLKVETLAYISQSSLLLYFPMMHVSCEFLALLDSLQATLHNPISKA